MVHHINVQITNRERTRAWYEQVLGATFLDRGPALNKRQLQLNLGNAELHFSDTDQPVLAPQPHFAVEVEDWQATLAHLDRLGVSYSRTGSGAFTRVGTGNEERWGRREDSGEY
jgi:catechol 2,3-dioxygenase-like lactoylglutathione lyase family enzyme